MQEDWESIDFKEQEKVPHWTIAFKNRFQPIEDIEDGETNNNNKCSLNGTDSRRHTKQRLKKSWVIDQSTANHGSVGNRGREFMKEKNNLNLNTR